MVRSPVLGPAVGMQQPFRSIQQSFTFGSRRACLIVHAAKGFGKTKQSSKEDANVASKQVKRVNVRPSKPQVPVGLADMAQQYDELEAARKQAEADAEFQERLELIKAEAAQKRAAGVPAAPASPSAGVSPAVFDAPVPSEDIYANPPSLLSTLQDQLQSDINDPALREAKIGPGQLGLAGGAVLFGLVFVLVAGGDFATTNRYKGLRPARPPPDPIEMSRLASQAERFEAKYTADSNDLESLEAAAVIYARMQDFGHAADLLDKLTVAHPDDSEAWRLLGESRLLNADATKSVSAYQQAIALDPKDQQIITGLVDAYVANSQQSKAVAYLVELRDQLTAAAAPAAAAAAASGSGSSDSSMVPSAADTAAATAAVLPQSQEETARSSSEPLASSSSSSSGQDESSGSRPPIDVIQVQLLLGKSYAAWRGHDQDALAAYDTLIGAFPSDFRGYLAKGIFLRDRGRQGDAERMFLQAKFYAPENLQSFIASRAGARTDVGPLPDNGLE